MGDEAFKRAWAEGHTITQERAVAHALAEDDRGWDETAPGW